MLGTVVTPVMVVGRSVMGPSVMSDVTSLGSESETLVSGDETDPGSRVLEPPMIRVVAEGELTPGSEMSVTMIGTLVGRSLGRESDILGTSTEADRDADMGPTVTTAHI